MDLLLIGNTFGYPSCLLCQHADILPGASFQDGLMMEPYGRVPSAIVNCVHYVFLVYCKCICRCYLCLTVICFYSLERDPEAETMFQLQLRAVLLIEFHAQQILGLARGSQQMHAKKICRFKSYLGDTEKRQTGETEKQFR